MTDSSVIATNWVTLRIVFYVNLLGVRPAETVQGPEWGLKAKCGQGHSW
jgi:hypothetical protein